MTDFLDLNEQQRRKFIRLQNTNYATHPTDVSCPYCNAKQSLEYEDMVYEDDHTTEHECYECSKTFDIHSSVEWTWRTEIPDDEAVEMVLKEDEKKV